MRDPGQLICPSGVILQKTPLIPVCGRRLRRRSYQAMHTALALQEASCRGFSSEQAGSA